MGKDFAKFMATTDKKIVFGDKDVELKLTIPHKVAQANLQFLTSSLNKEIHVILGDPQVAFDFDDEGEDMYKPYIGGRQVTADASGVVTSIQQSEESKDENQVELFDSAGESEEDGDQKDQQCENREGEPPAEDELNDYEKEIMGESEAGAESDLPEWMRESNDQKEDSGSGEMNFETEKETDQSEKKESTENNGEPDAGAQHDPDIEKSVIEQYILENRPSFPDLPLDFPDLYEKRRNQGLTWGNIAREIGMTTGQLNAKLNKYREAVKKQMIDGGAA
ncbi:hypothetical protein [Paenibacillus dokdonensis]|uniref:hypothetical protein n=1 Tax=Paenibacillus dokdonensis TaxID=2567944 RepID=UPI0010A80E44|nr:hypothetical protein [Paenibacillus dokdonensis]